MASIQFTEADRDERGFVRVSEPRSLADLLPPVESIKPQPIVRQPMTRAEVAMLACVSLVALYILFYAWATPAERHPPVSLPTAAPTIQATIAQPTPLPLLTAYFDYQNSGTATHIDPSQIERVVGQVNGWRLVKVGTARVWVEETQVVDGVPVDAPLPDLAPRTPVPQVAPQVSVAPPQVERCVDAGVPGKMVHVCGDGDLDAQARSLWLETYGGNIGKVGAPTPQVMR